LPIGNKWKNNNITKIIQGKNYLGVYTNMGKQKYDRIKILGILILVFTVVPLTAVTVTAASGSGGHGYHGGHGGHGHGHDNGGYGNGGWRGPGFGFYPPAPYGDGGDSDVVCGPYGCYWNEATAYLPKAVIAEQGW
jgi:hypothetical protein